jgi:uncharacterized protein (TIGR02246 family)
MRRILCTTVIALATFVTTATYADSNAAGPRGSDAKNAIEESNARFAKAAANNDASAMAAGYAADAWLLPPGSDIIKGRQGIREFFKSVTAGEVLNTIAQRTVEVEKSGNTAYEVGTFSWIVQPKGKMAATTVGKYIVVWKREADGTWKAYRDAWNTSRASE